MMQEAQVLANVLNGNTPDAMWEFVCRDLAKLINYKGKTRLKKLWEAV